MVSQRGTSNEAVIGAVLWRLKRSTELQEAVELTRNWRNNAKRECRQSHKGNRVIITRSQIGRNKNGNLVPVIVTTKTVSGDCQLEELTGAVTARRAPPWPKSSQDTYKEPRAPGRNQIH